MGRIIKPGDRAFRKALEEYDILSSDDMETYRKNYPTTGEKVAGAVRELYNSTIRPVVITGTLAVAGAGCASMPEQTYDVGNWMEKTPVYALDNSGNSGKEETGIIIASKEDIKKFADSGSLEINAEGGPDTSEGRITYRPAAGKRGLFFDGSVYKDPDTRYALMRSRPDGPGMFAVNGNFFEDREEYSGNFGDIDTTNKLWAAELLMQFPNGLITNLRYGERDNETESSFPTTTVDKFGVLDLGYGTEVWSLAGFFGYDDGKMEFTGGDDDWVIKAFGVKGSRTGKNFSGFANVFYLIADESVIDRDDRLGLNLGGIWYRNGHIFAPAYEMTNNNQSGSLIIGMGEPEMMDALVQYYRMCADTALGWTTNDFERRGLEEDDMRDVVLRSNWLIKPGYREHGDVNYGNITIGGTEGRWYWIGSAEAAINGHIFNQDVKPFDAWQYRIEIGRIFFNAVDETGQAVGPRWSVYAAYSAGDASIPGTGIDDEHSVSIGLTIQR